jgi:hypothetical protein
MLDANNCTYTQPKLAKDVRAFMKGLDFGGVKADASSSSEEDQDDQGPSGVVADGPSSTTTTAKDAKLKPAKPVEITPVYKKSGKGAWVRYN